MVRTDTFICKPNIATYHAVAVVPILDPKMIPMPANRSISPALRNEMVMTLIKELDCSNAVTMKPSPKLLYNLLVAFLNKTCNGTSTKLLNPSSSMIMPNSNIAAPAATSLIVGLKKKADASKTSIVEKSIFLIMVYP